MSSVGREIWLTGEVSLYLFNKKKSLVIKVSLWILPIRSVMYRKNINKIKNKVCRFSDINIKT